MANDAQGFDSLQVHMMKKFAKVFVIASVLGLASILFTAAPSYASSTSEYNSKVAAAKAKVAQVQAQLDTAKSQLVALQTSSNSEAQLLAEAQTEVTIAQQALDDAAKAYTDASSAYDLAFAEQTNAEDAYNLAVTATNSAIDTLEASYTVYEQAQLNSTNAGNAVTVAQANYDNSVITSGSLTATAGLVADIYVGISSLGNPPQRSTTAYTLCKTITVSNIDKNWGGGNIEGCGGDYVMIHYHGFITYTANAQVYFYAAADDGFYLTIDNQQVINDWSLKGCGGNSIGLFNFTANKSYAIDAWMYEWGGGACNTLYYQPINSSQWTVAPATFFTQQAVATTSKDPALKTILDQKVAEYVSAVAVEEQALTDYLSAQDAYDSQIMILSSKQQTLESKQAALNTADALAANAENVWQTKSDTYVDKNAILTSRKTKYSSVYAAIQSKAVEVSNLETALATANSELNAIPKPVTPPKVTKKVTSKPATVTKVVARPKFVPIPKL